MHSAFRLELEYLNIRLRKSRSSLLRLQSILTPAFREAVYQLSVRFEAVSAEDDLMREAENAKRREARLFEMGFAIGDILVLSNPDSLPISFKLERAEYQSRILALPGQQKARDGEVFRLQGSTIRTPGQSSRQVVYLIDTPADAARLQVRLRALLGGTQSAATSESGEVRAPTPTFLSGLSAQTILDWRTAPFTAATLQQLDAAKSVFFPKRVYWDAMHRRIHGKVDFSAHRLTDADPILSYVPGIYAEGRRLVKQLDRIEGQTVQSLMLFPTGTLIDVGPGDDPMWVKVERVDKGPSGVYIVGERMYTREDGRDRNVRVAVVKLSHAEQIRHRVKGGTRA